MNEVLYIVIPCYNEQEVLPITSLAIQEKLSKLISHKKINKESKILFVDDGSNDETWNIITYLCKKDKEFKGIKLTKNKGHQNALLAGLTYANKYADIIVSMDADLQDDINAIDKMIDEYKTGSQIVFGVRNSRKKDTWFKRTSAQLYYKIMKKLGVDIVYNHADYRLLSKKALNCLLQYQEVNLFLRGIIPQIGFKTSIVYYERNERVAGTSKYPLKKMLHLAVDGITSFSIKPLKLITTMGMIISIFSFLIMLYSLTVKLLGYTVAGWTFIIISIWLIGGIQMLFLGIIGEYIGKIYAETKHRPKYFIEDEA